ncbi:hypothetical protein [Pseudomaricurvus sp. HS19]|uniref:hypothetical protein n=1 Tax=Pseudomaricurvus sp. HS19 TaxID=2692626 RepID=UPI0013716ADE|nr:hypothetical protein [Pseudomaricurvus sp. HS19]MYM64074.1 hypothetical protein [Pseudomaricurvus sp. HS19]
MLLLIILLLVACTSKKTRIDGRQFIAVPEPAASKTVTLILSGYISCKGTEQECHNFDSQKQNLQKKYENCVARGMRRTANHVALVRHDDQVYYPTLNPLIEEFTRHGEIRTEDIQARLADTALDYVVSVRATTHIGDSELAGFAEGEDGVFVWGLGQAWEKTAFLEARIYSAKSGLLAAELTAKLTDHAFWMQTGFVIIPLIPVGWSPDVEGTNCGEMGEALGRFFSGAGNGFLEP